MTIIWNRQSIGLFVHSRKPTKKSLKKTTMKKSFVLVTEAFGHGFFALLCAEAYGLTAVAISKKENREEFEKEVDQIYNNLSFFYDLKKSTWEERKSYLAQGWDVRQDLLEGKISKAIWDKVAKIQMLPDLTQRADLPRFASLKPEGHNVLFVPQKLQSDEACGVTAAQQSVDLNVFEFLKTMDINLVLGQHFHKVNDLNKVETIARDFECYVPGLTEDKEVFGIRGVQHKKYWNLYSNLHSAVGIAGTHTWYMLACFPCIKQVILYNKRGVENWAEIAEAYRKEGRQVYAIGFDEVTDMKEFAKEVEKTKVNL